MEEKNLWAALLDFDFKEFITTRIIKILYILNLVGGAFVALAMVISGLTSRSVIVGILSLILGPLVGLLYVLAARVWLELVIVVFRIAENTGRLVVQGEGRSSRPPMP